MSFYIRNKTGGAIDIEDLGIQVPAGGGSPDYFDLTPEDPKQVATSDDLVAEIQLGNIVVLDPLDNSTELSAAVSEEIVRVHNDPHYRIRGGTLTQLDDVDTTGCDEGCILQYQGSPAQWQPSDPGLLISDYFVDGVDTTVTRDSPFTQIQIDVNDVFLRNTGDTLDSGTLTIAEGATLLISGDGGSGGATFTIGQDATATIATPTGNFSSPTQIVNKEYVDSIAGGLDWKESVRAASTTDVGGTFTLGSPAGPGDTITGGAGELDGVKLEIGDRVILKDQTDATENGIYVVTGLSGSPQTADYERAADQNGDPAAEVSGGNAAFVEEGDTYADSGWVVTGDGILTLGTDDIDWTQFAGAGSITGDVGIAQTGTTLALDLSVGEVTAATPALTDRIAFHDTDGTPQAPTGTQTYGATFSATFDALDVVYGISSNGIIVRTADDTYASRTITAAGLGDRDGIEVLNGDGVSGDPVVGLDIENLPYYTTGSPNGELQTTGRVAVYDPIADTNVYYNVSDIAGALASTNSFETWAIGTGDVTGVNAVADSSTDTITVNAGTAMSIVLADAPDSITFSVDTSQINLGDLGDVNLGSPTPVDGDVLVWRGSPGQWSAESSSTFGEVDYAFRTVFGDTGSVVANVAEDIITLTGGTGISTAATGSPQAVTFNLDFGNIPSVGSPTGISGGTEIIVNIGGDIYTTTLNELVASTIVGGNGIDVSTSGSPEQLTVSLDICGLTAGDTANLDITDTVAVCDGANTVSYTFEEIFNLLDVPSNVTGTGVVVKTEGSPDTFVTRDIVASVDEDLLGANVVNGDGVSGDIEVGVDIVGQVDPDEDMAAEDEFLYSDKSQGGGSPLGANRKITGQNIADGVANILGFGDLSVQQIGGSGSPGQFTLFLTDNERGKDLSITESSLTWAEASIGNNDWVEIGNATDADVSFIVPMNATIVRATAFSVNANNDKDVDLYLDAALSGTLLTIPSGTNTEVSDVTLNIDVTAGQRVRLRGGATGGTIQDMTVVIWYKWRT